MNRSHQRTRLILLLMLAGCRQSEGGGHGRADRDEPSQTYVNAYSKDVSFREDTVFLDGRLFSGHLLSFHPDGDTAACIGYADGVQEGLSRIWHANGQPAERRTYHRGRKVGTHTGWWPNGNQRFEYRFMDGEHHGSMREWYEDGKPYKDFHYNAGYEDGSQRMWWEDGRIRANYVVRDGRRYGLIGVKNCVNPKDSIDP
jgi:antitoxin component YwqK of YwqJK toxin-antitoxin module